MNVLADLRSAEQSIHREARFHLNDAKFRCHTTHILAMPSRALAVALILAMLKSGYGQARLAPGALGDDRLTPRLQHQTHTFPSAAPTRHRSAMTWLPLALAFITGWWLRGWLPGFLVACMVRVRAVKANLRWRFRDHPWSAPRVLFRTSEKEWCKEAMKKGDKGGLEPMRCANCRHQNIECGFSWDETFWTHAVLYHVWGSLWHAGRLRTMSTSRSALVALERAVDTPGGFVHVIRPTCKARRVVDVQALEGCPWLRDLIAACGIGRDVECPVEDLIRNVFHYGSALEEVVLDRRELATFVVRSVPVRDIPSAAFVVVNAVHEGWLPRWAANVLLSNML